MTDKALEVGKRLRSEIMGAARYQTAMEGADDFDRDFQNMLSEYAFGRIWGDDALSRKQHSLNTLCLLAALNRPNQFEGHFRAAIRNGCTREELRATLTQITGYAGFPAGVESFRIAKKVFKELEQEQGHP